MTKQTEHFSGKSGELPDDVRLAFLEILDHTLLHVRSHCNQRDLCFVLSDHAHNIPAFLKHPRPELLRFYWECERAPFIHQMESLSQKVDVFEPAWKIVEQEYERLRAVAS